MKEFFETYIQHQEDIEYFLQESLKNIGNLSNHKKNDFKQLYNIFLAVIVEPLFYKVYSIFP